MRLSDTEKKMIMKLRRNEEARRRWRWPMLLTGVFGLGVSGYSSTLFLPSFQKPDLVDVLLVACFLPQVYLGWLVGLWFIRYSLTNWNGNPQTRLLLRLLDEKSEG